MPFLPLILGAVTVAALIGVVVLSQTLGETSLPPPAPAFTVPLRESVAGRDVKDRTADSLVLVRREGDNTIEDTLALDPALAVERLAPARPADIAPGDTLVVLGVPNLVRNFAIRAVVAIPPELLGESNGEFPRTRAGFGGYEALIGGADRPLVAGLVERVDGDIITIGGPDGPIQVEANAGAALYRVEAADSSAIEPGDRVALLPSTGDPVALLVLP
jgi:hypothetical protein